MLFLAISFLAGVLTALAPCVLPLLPVIVGGSVAGGGRSRAFVISTSLGISVVLFTLLLKTSTLLIAVPQSVWELFSGVILVFFGLVMIFPDLWYRLPFVNFLNRGSNTLLSKGYQRNSLWGDVIMGASLGPVFSSCSPTYFVILATVLPASIAVGLLDLLAYAVGLSGFLLLVALLGQRMVDSLGIAADPSGWLRRTIGIIFLILGLTVATGAEARAETWLLNHGFDLSFIEEQLLGANSSESVPQGAVGTSTALLSPQEKAMLYQRSPELSGIAGYINTPVPASGQPPITIGEFKGKKVVLIDFWTYSCINCQREIPYLNFWYHKYASAGLEIIGVHTPEFAFEHVLSNVQQAVQRFGIQYPVVLDNSYATWNAFGNQFWPRVYLIDVDGYIVYDHAGEGDYAQTELAIQRTLAELAARTGTTTPSFSAPQSPQGALEVDHTQLGSPETYFGSNRNQFLGNGTQYTSGVQQFELPGMLMGDTLYLGGAWNIQPEFASNQEGGAEIQYEYKAKHVYFVAAAQGAPVTIKVFQDGQPLPPDARGADVNTNSEVTIQADRLYELVSNPSYGIHTLQIEVGSPGLQAYTFTFG